MLFALTTATNATIVTAAIGAFASITCAAISGYVTMKVRQIGRDTNSRLHRIERDSARLIQEREDAHYESAPTVTVPSPAGEAHEPRR